MGKRLTDQQIIDALYDMNGILAAAARKLGCTRQTIYNRMEKSPEIADSYEDASQTTTDKVEAKLVANCLKGKERSIFYYLNNKARDRGYGKPTPVALTDPTGTKEYGGDVRDAILGKLLPELTGEGEAAEG